MCLSMEIIPVSKNVIPPLGYVWKFPLLFQSYMSNGRQFNVKSGKRRMFFLNLYQSVKKS